MSTTGDGILTGLALADLMVRAGGRWPTLSGGLVERVPQRLVNVPVPRPERLADCAEVWEAVVKAEAELGHAGRVLLRPERDRAARAGDGRGAGGRARPTPWRPSSRGSSRRRWGKWSAQAPR